MDIPEAHTQKNSQHFKKFLKWTFVIFVVLFVGSVALGYSPLGVRELNNAFFSLFVHDERAQGATSVDDSTSSDSTDVTMKPALSGSDQPIKIVIDKIKLVADVQNPQSRDDAVLNNALLNGAVHYPGSGALDSDQNVFLFGHSSSLPVVHNQNFKVFVGLKTLEPGDVIDLYSKTTGYRYAVDSVRLALADDSIVSLGNEHKLILSTCDTLGSSKEERYIVEAHFVGSYPLTQ
jgi:hypothetical protein